MAHLRTRVLACMLAAMAGHGALACNVPVFRYALERWQPDEFRFTILHQAPLSSNEQAVVAAIRQASDSYAVNSRLTLEQAQDTTNRPLPWLLLHYPGTAGGTPAWQAKFNQDTARLLLDSPARRELVRRLAGGDSVVWVLLDGDTASAALLDSTLRRLEKEIELPPVDPEDPRTEGNKELKIAFSVLPVSRRNPAEETLVSMLINADPSFVKATGPIAYPVFGRGRLLTGLTGTNLTETRVSEVSHYLCGACSCEIKEQNPGVDLLIAADWEKAVANPVVRDPPLPPLVSLSTLAASASVPPASPAAPAFPVVTSALRRNLLFTLGGLVTVIALGVAAMMIKKR